MHFFCNILWMIGKIYFLIPEIVHLNVRNTILYKACFIWCTSRCVKTADAINAIEGVPVSRYAQVLSRSWAKGEITGEQMKQALLASHAKLAAQVRKHG